MFDSRSMADRLFAARRPGTALDGLPKDIAPVTIEQAYAVQDALVTLLSTELGLPAGYKIGCTNSAARTLLKVDSPFAGRCFTDAIENSPAVLRSSELHMIGIEPEIAVRIGTDMPANAAPWTADNVVDSVDQIMPAIEVVESRFSTWPAVGPLGAVSDNGVHRSLIIGSPLSDWTATMLNDATVVLHCDGAQVDSGVATNVDGGPLGALAWLANHLNARGNALRTGELVTTGVMCQIYSGNAGENLVADYATLGDVRVQIT
jgi:2-keto-4-pentenoate hydratase